jgi:hypothetical protein
MDGDTFSLSRMQRRQFLKMAASGFVLGATGGLTRFDVLAEEGSPIPYTDVVREQLFDVTLPKSTFPLDAYYAGFVTGSMKPGFDGNLVITEQVAQNIISLEGEMTFEKCGAAQVFRADGKVEEFTADDTFTIGPGEARLTFDFKRPEHITNRGSVPSRFIYAPIGFPTEYWDSNGDTPHEDALDVMDNVNWESASLSKQALTLRFDRFTIEAGATVKLPADTYPVSRILETGQLKQTFYRKDGTVSRPYTYLPGPLITLMFDTLQYSTWTNISDEPAVILEYHLQPVLEADGTPVA